MKTLERILLFISIAINAVLIVYIIDVAVTVDHHKSEILYMQQKAEWSLLAINTAWVGQPLNGVQKLGKLAEMRGAVYEDYSEKEGIVRFGGLVFEISEEKVISVNYRN